MPGRKKQYSGTKDSIIKESKETATGDSPTLKPKESSKGRKKRAAPSAELVPSPLPDQILPAAFIEARDNFPATLPDDYSPAMMTALCELIASSTTKTDALRLLGMRGKYEKWRKAAPEYIDSLIAYALSVFTSDLIARIYKASSGDKKQWTAAAWLLERRFPSDYALRGRVGGDSEKGPVNIFLLSKIPRPYRIARRIGKKTYEPGRAPDEIEAEQALVIDVTPVEPTETENEET